MKMKPMPWSLRFTNICQRVRNFLVSLSISCSNLFHDLVGQCTSIVFDIDPQDFPAVELCTTVQLIYYEHGKLYPIYAITEHFLPRFFFVVSWMHNHQQRVALTVIYQTWFTIGSHIIEMKF